MKPRSALVLALALAAPAAASTPESEPSPIAEAIARADEALAAIEALPDAERTWENTVLAVDDVQARFFLDARMPGFLSQVSTDPEERELGRQAAADMSNWYDRLYKREGLFRAVEAFAATEPRLEPTDQRYLDVLRRDFRRAGMELAAEQRERLAAIDEELTELGVEFGKNISDDESVVLLTSEECAGVPEGYLAELPRAAGLYVLALTGSMPILFLETCDVPTTREKVSVALSRRGGRKNVAVLEKMLRLRAQKAHLLGYQSIAEYVIEIRMATTPERVWDFYEDLRPKLRDKALADFAEFEAAKREHTGDPDAKLEVWDYSYYKSWLLRERYAVDQQLVREYFPLERVVEGIFDIYQELFGLRFEDVTARAAEAGPELWHEDVRLYEVWDRGTGELLGHFYTDLFPRPGKYSHAAQFPLEIRKRWQGGSLTRPRVALVCNFTEPTADRSALLTHNEVETFFHEFGHCLHSILTEADLSEFAGTAVARDFVEAPSQMLENWVWDADVLGRFARHYETGEPLPEEVLKGMIAAKNLGSGLSAESQVFLGILDLTYHTDEDGDVDTTAVRQDVYARTRLFDPIENVWGQASFGHLVGYEAGYYGYLWSLVYAQDMFSRFEREGILNTELAREYRTKVLAKGGSVDALDLVRDFLGREPSSEAFLRHLGLEE